MIVSFFFQAEDGIRDLTVTGVQTCALPIFLPERGGPGHHPPRRAPEGAGSALQLGGAAGRGSSAAPCRTAGASPEGHSGRSEERRVGKECRSRWSPSRGKKNSNNVLWRAGQ